MFLSKILILEEKEKHFVNIIHLTKKENSSYTKVVIKKLLSSVAPDRCTENLGFNWCFDVLRF